MKVAILTMFSGLQTTYSLVNVVENQIGMLISNGEQVKHLVCEDCKDSERFGNFLNEKLEWVKITNRLNGKQITWYDYSQATGKLHSTFYDEVEVIKNDYIKNLQDVDVCIMHDILYQGWHYVHNIAIREAQKQLPNVKFIAFTHSLPVNRPITIDDKFAGRYTPMANTVFVYPTQSGISYLAKQYNAPEGACRVVYNVNPTFDYMSSELIEINKKVDLLDTDILVIYPARLTKGKQFEKVAAFCGAIKSTCEKTVKIIFCDFPCMDIDSNFYKNEIRQTGTDFGLQDGDIYFTTDLGFENGINRQTVMELFTLSNLYICPSYSESFGLTVLEAASRGNFIVVNEAVPALFELGKSINAHFMRWDARNFGFNTSEAYNPSEKAYYAEHANIIINKMRENEVLFAKDITRTKYNAKWVYKNQLEPIFK